MPTADSQKIIYILIFTGEARNIKNFKNQKMHLHLWPIWPQPNTTTSTPHRVFVKDFQVHNCLILSLSTKYQEVEKTIFKICTNSTVSTEAPSDWRAVWCGCSWNLQYLVDVLYRIIANRNFLDNFNIPQASSDDERENRWESPVGYGRCLDRCREDDARWGTPTRGNRSPDSPEMSFDIFSSFCLVL